MKLEYLEMPADFYRVAYLQELCNRYGDLKVACNYKNGDETRWSKHRSVFECWHSEKGIHFLSLATHRQQLPHEVILDIETNNLNELKRCIDFLKQDSEIRDFYKIFSTGSRGFHIHYNVFMLGYHNLKQRSCVKKSIIYKLGTDRMKASENTMIAMEWVPHWKSGKIKQEVRLIG